MPSPFIRIGIPAPCKLELVLMSDQQRVCAVALRAMPGSCFRVKMCLLSSAAPTFVAGLHCVLCELFICLLQVCSVCYACVLLPVPLHIVLCVLCIFLLRCALCPVLCLVLSFAGHLSAHAVRCAFLLRSLFKPDCSTLTNTVLYNTVPYCSSCPELFVRCPGS